MNTRSLLRRRLLEKIYNDLSDEDKHTFVRMTMEDKGYRDIMQAIQSQRDKLDEIHKAQSWWYDLSANVAGSALWDALRYIGMSIIKR